MGSVGKKQCIGGSFSEPFKGPFETEEEMNQAILRTYNSVRGGFFSTMLKNML